MKAQHVTTAIMAISLIAAVVMLRTEINTAVIIAVWAVPFFVLAKMGIRSTTD